MTVTLRETLRRIRTDYRRMSKLMGIALTPARIVFLAITPSIVALTLYRLSHWLYVKRIRFLAWFLWIVNTYLTGADIPPKTSIGESCYVGHPVGIKVYGWLGDRVILFGGVAIGGGRGGHDIGPGEGLPIIGSDVVVGEGAKILGSVRVGDRVIVGASALVIRDVEAGVVVAGIPARVVKSRAESVDYEALAKPT